jgi:hypothetical protein
VLALGDWNCRDSATSLPTDADARFVDCKIVADPTHCATRLVVDDDWVSLNAEFVPGQWTRPASRAVLDLAITNAPELVSDMSIGLPDGHLSTRTTRPLLSRSWSSRIAG